jgi:hypothetical protein
MTTTIKSVHIKECWPFQYEAPVMDARARDNARKREAYRRKKAATVKTTDGKKLLQLPVYGMSDNDFFESINQCLPHLK